MRIKHIILHKKKYCLFIDNYFSNSILKDFLVRLSRIKTKNESKMSQILAFVKRAFCKERQVKMSLNCII